MRISNISSHSLLRHGSLLAAGALLSLSAVAATGGASAELQARYQQDRAKCLSGTSGQALAPCLKEAGAARDAGKRGQLDDGAAHLRQNQKLRCAALSGDEARDCLARMEGQGTTSGSVKEGGIYRESVTYEVKPVPVQSTAPATKP